MQHNNPETDFNQGNLINNYNLLVDALRVIDVNYDQLDNDGACKGLSLNYILYTATDRTEYLTYLNFIDSLKDKQAIDALVNEYQKKKDEGKILWVAVDMEDEQGNQERISFPFEKIMRIMEGVQKAQKNKSYKSIRANLDRNFIFFTHKLGLAQLLKSARIAEGKIMGINMGKHFIVLERITGGFYIFEPNRIRYRKKIPKLLKNEDEVANELIDNFRMYGSDNNVGFAIQFISYGDKNRDIDDAIQEFSSALNKNQEFVSLISQYNHGKLSRVELALLLHEKILNSIKENASTGIDQSIIEFDGKLVEFLNSEKNYLDQKSINSLIAHNAAHKALDSVAYLWKSSWLDIATRCNEATLTKKLLLNGANPNKADARGFTPVHTAAQEGNLESLRELLAHGGDPNVQNINGFTPVYAAAACGYGEAVKILLASGGDDTIKNEHGVSPLYAAAAHGHLNCVKELINYRSISDKELKFLLYVAVENGHSTIVRELLTYNISAILKFEDVKTLLMEATKRNHVEVVRVLLSMDVYRSNVELCLDLAKTKKMSDLLNCEIIFYKVKSLLTSKQGFFSTSYTKILAQAQKLHPDYFEEKLLKLLNAGVLNNNDLKELCTSKLVNHLHSPAVLDKLLTLANEQNINLNKKEMEAIKSRYSKECKKNDIDSVKLNVNRND